MRWSLRGKGRGGALGRVFGPFQTGRPVPEPAVEPEIRIEDFHYPSSPPPPELERNGLVVPPLVSLGAVTGGEVLAFVAPAAERVSWWHRIRFVHPMTGLWPVLFGTNPSDGCDALSGSEFSGDYDGADVLDEASRTSMAELPDLREMRATLPELAVDDAVARLRPTHGPAPAAPLERAAPNLMAGWESGLVGLVPAAQGWQVPGILGFSVDMQHTSDHVVVLREWHARYAAELVSLGDEQTMEVLVGRPPTSPADALVLAQEQCCYCPEVLNAVGDDLPKYARELQGARSWFFWWD